MYQDIKDLQRGLDNILSRGVIKRYDSSRKTARMQTSLYADEVRSDIEHPQEFGFASAPHEGAETMVAFFGGNRDAGTVLKTFDKRYHPTGLAPGETKIYTSDGTYIHLQANGNVSITAGTKITITSPNVEITGNLAVHGDITDHSTGSGKSMLQMRTIYNSHTHAGGPVPDQSM